LLATGRQVLQKANKGNYAVGAFNINNMEFLQAIVSAAEKMKSPVMIATSEGAIKYAGLCLLKNMVYCAAENAKVPVVLHLDHGRDMDVIKKCIDIGYTSVMIDASHLEYDANIKTTKQVVQWACRKGVSVEAELGTIGGVEEKISARKIIYTDPEKAVDFVERTGIDSLAVAIGTSHGAYKFAGAARLNLNVLKEIKKKLDMPLVLHGASGLPAKVVQRAKRNGVRLGKAEGVPDSQISQAVRLGINKINTDTDLRIAFTSVIRESFRKNPAEFDPRHYLGPAKEFVQEVVEHRIGVFGGRGKA